MSQKPREECLKEKGASDCAGDGWAWRYLLDLAARRPRELWQGAARYDDGDGKEKSWRGEAGSGVRGPGKEFC